MRKDDLIKIIAGRLDLPEINVVRVVAAYEAEIQDALIAGNDVTIRGVVRLIPAIKPAAERRNPRTGEKIEKPECRTVKAKVLRSLKEKIK